jgi:ATP-dependent protease ClpP protease subunit
MSRRVKHDESNYVSEVHDNGLLLAHREIFLHSIFDTEEVGTDFRMANRFIKNLRVLESLNHNPVFIHQYNIGGDWNSGMSIYDMILQSPCKVIFICHGISASMGSIIPQAADVRITMPNCDWLLHEGYTDIDSGLTHRQAKSWAQWEQKAYDKMMEIYVETSNLSASRIKNMFSKREDWWLSAEEAVENGFADIMLGDKEYESIDSVKQNVS